VLGGCLVLLIIFNLGLYDSFGMKDISCFDFFLKIKHQINSDFGFFETFLNQIRIFGFDY
jgi:hypothetical protein